MVHGTYLLSFEVRIKRNGHYLLKMAIWIGQIVQFIVFFYRWQNSVSQLLFIYIHVLVIGLLVQWQLCIYRANDRVPTHQESLLHPCTTVIIANCRLIIVNQTVCINAEMFNEQCWCDMYMYTMSMNNNNVLHNIYVYMCKCVILYVGLCLFMCNM